MPTSDDIDFKPLVSGVELQSPHEGFILLNLGYWTITNGNCSYTRYPTYYAADGMENRDSRYELVPNNDRTGFWLYWFDQLYHFSQGQLTRPIDLEQFHFPTI